MLLPPAAERTVMPNFSFSQRNNAYIEMPVSQWDLTQRTFVHLSFGMHSGFPAKNIHYNL